MLKRLGEIYSLYTAMKLGKGTKIYAFRRQLEILRTRSVKKLARLICRCKWSSG